MKISRAQARAFQVSHRLLDPRGEGPAFTVEAAVDRLGCIQIDPMLVVEKNHELVLHARLPGYRRGELEDALYDRRTLVEAVTVIRCIIPTAELPYFRPLFRSNAARHAHRAEELRPLMAEVRNRLETAGPLASTDLEHTERISGWWDADGKKGTRAVRQALEWMWHFGEVVVARREGTMRCFDLTEKIFPDLYDGVTEDESGQFLARKYFLAAGLFHPSDFHFGFCRRRAPEKRQLLADGVRSCQLVEVEIEGAPRTYHLHRDLVPELERQEPLPGDRCVLLPPLDNLLWDRRLISELFEFDYSWEAYIPRDKRRYGPYTMPVLMGDRLVGRVDAKADRPGRELAVRGLWWEPGCGGDPSLTSSLREALAGLASFVLGDDARVDLGNWSQPG